MLHGDPEPSMAPNIVEEVLDIRLIIFNGTTYLRIGHACMEFHREPEPKMPPNSGVLM